MHRQSDEEQLGHSKWEKVKYSNNPVGCSSLHFEAFELTATHNMKQTYAFYNLYTTVIFKFVTYFTLSVQSLTDIKQTW